MDVTVLEVEQLDGYEIRNERIDYGDANAVEMKSAYTPNGDYIGDPNWARLLIAEKGIKPEKADPGHSVCSIGFCEREHRWYGWSHRAMCGFAIGDIVKEGDVIAGAFSVGFIANLLPDCRAMAVAYADEVSG
jgi:hypothetical protein